ncbi:MAG: tetratricopeptide repeat protein [Bacteroidales bacterium]|nr:tetratricopeptide repeat protein [Bacteroidales bacterium]
MTQRKIYEWMRHPEQLNAETLYELRTLLGRYPFYQTVRLLYLKNLYLLGDPSFKEELQRSALYVADLGMLFYYIEGDRFALPHYLPHSQEENHSGGDRTLDLIDRFLSDLQTPAADTLPIPPVEAAVDYASWLASSGDAVSTPACEAPMQGQEWIDRFIQQAEEHSKTSAEGPVGTSEVEPSVTSEVETSATPEVEPSVTLTVELPGSPVEEPSVASMIEPTETQVEGVSEFPRAEIPSASLSEESPVSQESDVPERPSADEAEDESYFTETLAKIYVKQQRYDKALEIIKKLNLKYPKKNAYFADQMRFLEKLIINAKSK